MAHVWQFMCTVITTVITRIWWASCVAHVHNNYYYMVEGSPHMWLMCTVITTIYGGGEPSRVAINMHSKYSYTVEGSPHVWVMCGN